MKTIHKFLIFSVLLILLFIGVDVWSTTYIVDDVVVSTSGNATTYKGEGDPSADDFDAISGNTGGNVQTQLDSKPTATLTTTVEDPGSDTNVPSEKAVRTAITASPNGTVTAVSVTTANGVSGTVTDPTTTPAISLTLGAITPTSVAATGQVSGATYGSNGTVSDGELLYINSLGSNAQDQIDGKANLADGNTWTGDQDFGVGNLITSGTIGGRISTVSTNQNPYAATTADCSGGIIHITAAGQVNLLAAAPGMSTMVKSTTAAVVLIDPDGEDVIVLDGVPLAAGVAIKNPNIAAGEYITLYCVTATQWETVGNPKTFVAE